MCYLEVCYFQIREDFPEIFILISKLIPLFSEKIHCDVWKGEMCDLNIFLAVPPDSKVLVPGPGTAPVPSAVSVKSQPLGRQGIREYGLSSLCVPCALRKMILLQLGKVFYKLGLAVELLKQFTFSTDFLSMSSYIFGF